MEGICCDFLEEGGECWPHGVSGGSEVLPEAFDIFCFHYVDDGGGDGGLGLCLPVELGTEGFVNYEKIFHYLYPGWIKLSISVAQKSAQYYNNTSDVAQFLMGPRRTTQNPWDASMNEFDVSPANTSYLFFTPIEGGGIL